MKFASIQSLQRDYGLPFVTAASIIDVQMALARRHHRVWFMLGGVSLAIVLVSAFALPKPLASTTFHVALPCACLCTAIGELLVRRRALPSILAAAHAASADTTRSS